ncbi:MAG: hypothetical protein DLM62_20580 [Pseudonocardiales bacterium]|nr:MAG: hypothetical protein DLM62_20580 [Pseudonocardiales bacterium]
MTYALADRVQPGITRTWQVAPTGTIEWPDDISPLIGRSGEHAIPTYSLAPAGSQDRTRSIASDFPDPTAADFGTRRGYRRPARCHDR